MTAACFDTHPSAAQVGVIFGNPEITSGGNALKFYASVRLEVRRKETIKGPAGGDDVGIRVKAKARGPPCLWQLPSSQGTLLLIVLWWRVLQLECTLLAPRFASFVVYAALDCHADTTKSCTIQTVPSPWCPNVTKTLMRAYASADREEQMRRSLQAGRVRHPLRQRH